MSASSLKHIAILGSTGSIGTQTLDIVRRLPEYLRVAAIAAGSNADLVLQQALEFDVKAVGLVNEDSAALLEKRLPKHIEQYAGESSLEMMAVRPDVDIVVVAVAGAIGTRATVAALLAGKTVALATKEVLVAAGEVVVDAAKRGGGRLVPIDSEHSGVFQCLSGAPIETVKKIWLTASGGPFRTWTSEQIDSATVEDALNHPTWRMGRKITVDSATMMNKGLEIIEAKWLFNVSIDQVAVVVHPQSTIHALVQYNDGSLIAQMGTADMRLPIEYALLYPQRIDAKLAQLDILKLGTLNFEAPDEGRFPCLRLAREASIKGGTAPSVMNGANEAAVLRFLEKRLPFVGIAKVVEQALTHHTVLESPSLEQILKADEWARDFVSEAVSA
jgi:1-deoxy-D-xylulose-5-phosphate reductoisomerase